VRRGRNTHGETHVSAKLTAKQVEEIRLAGPSETAVSIAKRYVIGEAQVRKIMRNMQWHNSDIQGIPTRKYHAAKLQPAQVLAIREAHRKGTPQRALAKQYHVAGRRIFNIVHRLTWSDLSLRACGLGDAP